MKNAIILHGTCGKEEYYSDEYPSASNSHWLPWLQKQLLIRDIHAITPEIPHGYTPNYEIWKGELERNDIISETILIGHSSGGGFILRYLSEDTSVKVGCVVLVAPWLDLNNTYDNDSFQFKLDGELASRTSSITIFNSDDDADDVQASVRKIREEIKDISYKEFQGKGHFTLGDLKTEAFPELLEAVL